MDYEVRLAEKNDAGIIVELLNKVTLYLHQKNINQWEYPWDSEEIESDIESRNTYVITLDNLVVGTFSIKVLDTDTGIPVIESNNLYLYRIAILPEYQGKKLGLKVTDYACSVSRDLKKVLYLDCWAGNANLKNFYSKAGFYFCGDFPEEDYMISVFKYEYMQWGEKMLPGNYIEIIKLICEELSKSDINWVLTGSTSFIIQGMGFAPNDIDIQTDKKGAYEIENHFKKFVKRRVEYFESENIRSHFGELNINGIKIEIMGDIQKFVNGCWEDTVDINEHKCLIEYHGMKIPVLDLGYESDAYEKMGRIDKAKLLRQWKIEINSDDI